MLHILLLGLCAISAVTSQCTPNIPDADRRNCFAGAAGTWPGLNQSVCEARGCVWCNTGTVQCYANDYVCPSSIPEANRVDCHPEPGASRAACNNRGCVWCEATSGSYPYCFYDSTVSQGGVRCPTEIPEAERVDCWPHALSANTEKYCLARSCYYCATSTPDVPWCVKPHEHGYTMVGQPTATTKGWRVDATRKNYPTWFGADVQTIRVDVEFHESHRLRVKIYDPSKPRFEVPLQIPSPDRVAANTLYDIQFVNNETFGFIITRKSTGAVIFDSTLAGIEFSDQGLVMAWRVPTDKVYGFGETEHHAFKHAFNWEKWGMFARDQPVVVGNLYGVQPFYLGLDSTNPPSSTSAYGVLILNSNPQEIQMMPAPGITYRTQGGILDFYFFLGPTPENVVQQYTEAVGRPIMPAYWSLGFQLSRYGFNTLDNMKAAVDRTRQYNIPLDVVHGDINYFRENLDFTYDTTRYAGLPQYVNQLHAEGTKFITILDPFISTGEPAGTYPPYERGNQLKVWITESDGVTPALGKCWPEDPSYYPDYSKESAVTWWTQECVDLHSVIPFDGLWIDMNEPASFVAGSMVGCANNMLNEPPWVPQSLLETKLYDKTLCMDFRAAIGTQYDTHNLYGWAETLPSLWATRNATGGKRSIVIGRSTFPGAGKYAGHWTGDNTSSWAHLVYSIIGLLEFNLFGMPYIGADICGYMQDTTEELCHRWMQLGAFYTFSRNHNGMNWIDQDPGVWPAVASASRSALNVRYTLLPYLYTLFHYAHVNGNTVIRPLLHEFVTDSVTHTIDRQLLWGPALLITPVVDQGARTVRGYFPNARWYDWYTGAELAVRGAYTTLDAPLETIPVHLRGGYVIPTQEPANSTFYSRTKPMGLIVTLSDSNSATGSLFWDEGDTIDTYETNQYFLGEYVASSGSLTGSVSYDGYPATSSLIFKTVSVYGVATAITSVTVNGATWTDFTYNANTKVLLINNLTINVVSTFTVTWA